MADFYVDSGSGALAYANRAWSLGDRMVPAIGDGSTNALVAKAWVWECTTAGTTTATPTWPASVTQDTTTVTQGGATFKARKPGFSSGSTVNWTFATTFIQYALLAAAAGDRVFVINTHSQTSTATSLTWASNGTISNLVSIICLNNKTTSAPTSSDLGTGAKETTNTNLSITMTGSFYCYGVNLDNGTASNTSTLSFCASANACVQVFEQCTFRSMSTSSTAVIVVGNSQTTGTSRCVWRNCGLTFNNTAGIRLNNCMFEWRGGTYTAGASSPAILISQMGIQGGRGGSCKIIGVDISALATGASIFPQGAQGGGFALIRDCKMPSSWSGALISNTPLSFPFGPIEGFNLSVDGVPITEWRESFYGTLRDETTVVQGSNAYSWKITSSANASFPDSAFESVEIFEQVAAGDVGVSKTYTIPFIHDSASALNDDDIYADVWYPGSSTTSQYSKASDAKANVLASSSAQTTSSASWSGTGGLGSPTKQEVAVTFTPQQTGQIIIGVRVCKPSYTVYVSPFGTLS